MKVNKQELVAALEAVKPGIASKEVIEQSTSFAFRGGRVVTYNDEISISHPVKGLDIEGAIKADEFYQLLNKTTKEEIDLDVTESEVRMDAGKTKAGITLQQEVTLPLDEVGSVAKWHELPKGFVDAISFAMFSCSKDMSRPVLTCVHVDKKKGHAESSDNYRLTRRKFDGKLPVKSFLLPSNSVAELIRYPITHIAQSDGWMHFKTDDDTIFSCRIYQEKFPDTSALFKVEGTKIRLPKTIETILDRAEIFSKRDHFLEEAIQITLEKNKLKIRSEADYGWIEEEAKIKYKGDPVTFSINPSFLEDICKQVRKCTLGPDRMKFTGDEWEHVVALNEDES